MRLFIALELPPDVCRAAAGLGGELRRSGADAKWVRPEAMHLTLKFLGETPPRLVEALSRGLEGARGPCSALALELFGCGAFPSPQRPRVVWAGVRGQVEELAGLAARIDETVGPLGFAPEARAYTPHLTLGRVRPKAKGLAGLKRELAGHIAWQGPKFTASRVGLIKSELAPAGARYHTLHHIVLG